MLNIIFIFALISHTYLQLISTGKGYVYVVPYLVAFIGLENILIITRSVVSTPPHLDVKVGRARNYVDLAR